MADMLFPLTDRRSSSAASRRVFGRRGTLLPLDRGASNVAALPTASVTVPPVIGDILAYWCNLRAAAGGTIPARADVDPKAISAHLGQVFIASLRTPRVARLRIVGAGIADLIGLDPRGMVLSALFAGPARDEVTRALAQVAAGARVILPLQSEPVPGQARLTAVMALMPLRGADGQVNQILGVIGVNGSVGPFPRRLMLASQRIVSQSAAVPAAPTKAAMLPVKPSAAADILTPEPLPQNHPMHLTVIHGGKN